MDSKTTITFEGEYIFVQDSGENSYEHSLDLWKNIAKACKEHECFKILGVSNMNSYLKTIDAFKHVNIAKEAEITPDHKIAWVELNSDAFKSIKFIENVIFNRGLTQARTFLDVAKARKWLLEE